MGQLREHSFELKGYLLRTNIIPHFVCYLSGRVDSDINFTAIAGVVSGFAAGITAWQSESGANRKINRYTNAVVAF